MKSLEQTYEIEAPVKKVWRALVDPEIINAWGGGPAKMAEQMGTEFSLWGGDIWGKNTEVEPNKKLVQQWYGGPWPEPSVCEFELTEKGGQTILTLKQSNIPDDELAEIEKGWKEYYLGPLKELVEKTP